MMIAVFGAFGVLARARVIVPILTGFMLLASALASLGVTELGLVVPLLADKNVIFLGTTFLVGATIGIYSDKIPYDDRLGILSGLVFGASVFYGGFAFLGYVAGGYFVLYLGARLPKSFQWIGAKNDYSYGIYIYGFLVQQCLAALGVYKLGYWPFMLAALPITFALAWLSWHGIEKRAMALKSWGPGRGIDYWWNRARAMRKRADL